MPELDVKVVPTDENRFGSGHGYNTSPSGGTSAAITSATGKIKAKAQLLAGMALETLTGVAEVGQRRVAADLDRPGRVEDDRRHRAVRTRQRRAAARRRGRPRRTDRLQRLVSVSAKLRRHLDLTSSSDLQVPNSAEYGFIPKSVCLMIAAPVSRPSGTLSSNVDRRAGARQFELADDVHLAGRGPDLYRGRVELDRGALQHLLVDRLLDVGLVVVPEAHPAAPLEHAAATRESAVELDRLCAGSSAISSVADHVATSIMRLCPASAAAPPFFRPAPATSRCRAPAVLRRDAIRNWHRRISMASSSTTTSPPRNRSRRPGDDPRSGPADPVRRRGRVLERDRT